MADKILEYLSKQNHFRVSFYNHGEGKVEVEQLLSLEVKINEGILKIGDKAININEYNVEMSEESNSIRIKSKNNGNLLCQISYS